MAKPSNQLRLEALKASQQTVNQAFFTPSECNKAKALEAVGQLLNFVQSLPSEKPTVSEPVAQPKVEDNRLALLEEKFNKLLEALASGQPKVEPKPKASPKPKPKASTRRKPKASVKASPTERVADQQEKASYGSRKQPKVVKRSEPIQSTIEEGKKAVSDMASALAERAEVKKAALAAKRGVKLLDGESPEDAIRRMKLEAELAAKAAMLAEFEASLQSGQFSFDF